MRLAISHEDRFWDLVAGSESRLNDGFRRQQTLQPQADANHKERWRAASVTQNPKFFG
jgi:hypothetical protein